MSRGWCREGDSNAQLAPFREAAAANWATPARSGPAREIRTLTVMLLKHAPPAVGLERDIGAESGSRTHKNHALKVAGLPIAPSRQCLAPYPAEPGTYRASGLTFTLCAPRHR